MNKKFSVIIALCLGLSIFLGSCSDDDDNKTKQVSQEWIDYQKSRITDVISLKDDEGNKVYTPLEVELAKGMYSYYRPSEWIKNILEGNFDKNGPVDFEPIPKEEEAEKREVIERIKYDTDIAVVRYHGWFYDIKGNKYVFDSTETEKGYSGKKLNNPEKPREFEVGPLYVEGFKAILYEMKVGDEYIVSIPQNLAYGPQGSGEIPGYTTLFFDIMLLEVKRD